MERVGVEIKFALRSPFHTTGDRLSLSLDRPHYVSPLNKEVAIPASTIKGWLREGAERVLRAMGEDVHLGPKPQLMCLGASMCKICTYFGSPRNKGRLLFQDAKLKEPFSLPRIGIGISRKRNTVEGELLFSLETVYSPELSAEIKGFFPSIEETSEAIALLYAAYKSGFALGGTRSRGLGWVEPKDFKAVINRKEFALSEIDGKLEEMWSKE